MGGRGEAFENKVFQVVCSFHFFPHSCRGKQSPFGFLEEPLNCEKRRNKRGHSHAHADIYIYIYCVHYINTYIYMYHIYIHMYIYIYM